MADFFPAPDASNYLIGGNRCQIDGVDVGNVVSGVITPVLEEVSVYNAVKGKVGPDYHSTPEEVVSATARLDVSLVLDELDIDNFHLFFGGERDGATLITPLLRRRVQAALFFEAVSDTGMNFEWNIPVAIITPSGDLSYDTADWVTIQLNAEVFPNVNTPDTPFGQIELLGANING